MNNPSKSLHQLIIMCWITVICYSIIKIFFPTCFEIVCESESFIKFGELADNSFLLKVIIGLCSSYLCYWLYYGALLSKFWLSKRETIIFLCALVPLTILKVWNANLGLISDIALLFIIPIIFMKQNKVKIFPNILIAFALNLGFQVLSAFTKNLSISYLPDNNGTAIALIYSIDVYLMLGLYYLYTNLRRIKKENE